MIIFGFGDNLRANPGLGRDWYDDQVPTEVLTRLRECMQQVSPGLRNFVIDTKSKILFAKAPAFYEGMVCGLTMAIQMLTDLQEGDPTAQAFYTGISGLIGVQAGIIANQVLEERIRVRQTDQPEGPTDSADRAG